LTEKIATATTSSRDAAAGAPVRLEGWWRFDEGSGDTFADASGNGHTLTPTGGPTPTTGGRFGGAIAFDGATQWLSTARPVLRTDESFSVAAWLRLDRAAMRAGVQLPENHNAVTAVSQDAPTHSPFYLGARLARTNRPDGFEASLRWTFTVAPTDDGTTDIIEWCHAHSTQPVEVDQWVLLVGVYDLSTRTARLYVPGTGDRGTYRLPEVWPRWHAPGGLQIGQARYSDKVADVWPGSVGPTRVGQARYLDSVADLWPGSVGPVRAYTGVLTEEDAASLYAEDSLSSRSR
jgi:concanavalin A-like lectin/glucanase superfamily protein